MSDRTARLQRLFGSTIRVERIERRLTQRELARAARLSVTYVGEVERGERDVSLDTVARLATALDLTAADLLARARL